MPEDLVCSLHQQQSCTKTLVRHSLAVWVCAAPTVEQIDIGIAWSLEHNRQGRGVYVHCAHGHGRSNVVLCAVLISVGVASSVQEVCKAA